MKRIPWRIGLATQARRVRAAERWRRKAKSRSKRGRKSNDRRLSRFQLRARWLRLDELEIRCGETFSIIENPNGTIEKFLTLTAAVVEERRPVFLNTADTEIVTIDSLLYLLAMTSLFNTLNCDYAIRGRMPRLIRPQKLFMESGFLNFCEKNSEKIDTQSECVQIHAGYDADPTIAKRLCQFAMRNLNLKRTETKGLYDIVMEIILNTIQHAYDKSPSHQKWFAYARYDKEDRSIQFSILDAGMGIPKTVKRTFKEFVFKLAESLGIESANIDPYIIESALNGQHRTQTGQAFRGKGIPRIHSYAERGYIEALTIVSNRGYVRLSHGVKMLLDKMFIGTLYSWRMRNADNHSE